MKKLLLILSLFLFSGIAVMAQDDDDHNEGNERIRDKMNEYIQKRLRISRTEAEKFSPVFLRYFREWRTTIRQFKADRLILQQRIVDLRLRYRSEFRDILGENRANEVFDHQEGFIKQMRILKEKRTGPARMRNNRAVQLN
jgi:hypothetical protein